MTAGLKQLHRLSTTNYDTLDQVFSEYLKTGCHVFRTQIGVLLQVDNGDTVVRAIHGASATPRRGSRIPPSVGVAGLHPELRVCLTAPILVDNELYGTLSFSGTDRSAFTFEEQELIQMMASSLGRALEQRQLTDRLEYQAQHDSLTGLPNRLHLLELLAKRLLEAESRKGLLAVFFIDLDRFKQINDTLGHLIGDRILIQVAERLKHLLHENDVVGRMGGDEFTVILSSPPDEEFVFRAARQLLQSLRAPYMVDQLELFVTASIGISFYPQDGEDTATLLQKSDLAMYSAKNAGKNDLEYFVKDSRSTARERLDMENALRRAQEKHELELNFQPIVAINGELDGMEVLLSWNHPKLGRISPKQFIPIAEESGLIVSIGSWVIHQACLQGSRWIAAGLRPTRLSVNASAIQFARHDFVDTVADALASTDFPARCLDLELT